MASVSAAALLVKMMLVWIALGTVRCQQQRFRVRPSNVSVVEGDSAILRCEVQHQVGQLQWAKDGFALGYSRQLPGHARYRMLGEPGSGVHDLEITNVTLEDDGRFQCQVSPNRGQDAIRADAILTVLVKPRLVRLGCRDSSPTAPEGTCEVREGDQLTLECDVIGGRPAPSVGWRREGEEIHPGQDLSFSAWGHPGRNDTTSVVTLRPTAADDGAGFSCVALHPAIAPEDQQKLNATVRLSVLHPPGAPEISGYTEGEVVSIGQQKTLTCISRGGNPPAQLVWLKNGRPIAFKYREMKRRVLAQFTFTVTQADLSTIYRCEASSIVQPQPTVALAQMNVQFGPERVTVSGTQEARSGDTVHMSCTTSSSNPPANITWVINGRTMMNTTQKIEHIADVGWVSRSNVTAAVPAGMTEDMVFSCYAVNSALPLTKLGTATVHVLYPPDPPSILGYEPGTQLRSGERVSLSCVSQGGNPPATLTWYRDDTELAASTEVHDSVARSVVTFQVDHTDNGRAYTCRSTNSGVSGFQSASVSLNVHFPPAGLSVEVRPEVLRSGSAAILTCESRPSYPAADLTWWRDNVQVTDGVTALETFKAGNKGGLSSRLQLRLNLTWMEDGAVFGCRSDVSPTPGGLIEETTLSVIHPPTFPQPVYEITIVEGDSRVENLTARANPGGVWYTWHREEDSAHGAVIGEMPWLPADTPLLTLSGVKRAQAGWYRLTASNSQGNATVRVHVNVQYPPEVVSVSDVSLIAAGEDGVLECSVDANPAPADMITWHRTDWEDVISSSRVSTFTRNGTSYLTVHNASRTDSGQFQCRADNGVGRATANAALLVKQAAEFVDTRQWRRAATEEGGVAQLTCRARGVPNVTFEWSKRGGHALKDSDKYQYQYTQVDLVTWQSVLRVADVQPSDYATYLCVAHNELGSQQQQIVLGRPSAPDPPLGLQVVNVSHDSATVTWQPGFDGGQQQVFQVRYYALSGKRNLNYVKVQPQNATQFTVSGLAPDTIYSFDVRAYNNLGKSVYSMAAEGTTMRDEVSVGQEQLTLRQARLPWTVIIAISAVGGVLLILNALLIVFFVRRRRRRAKNTTIDSASTSDTSTKSEAAHMYGGGTDEPASPTSVNSLGGSFSRGDSLEESNGTIGSGGVNGGFGLCLGVPLLAPLPSSPADLYVLPTPRSSGVGIGIGVGGSVGGGGGSMRQLCASPVSSSHLPQWQSTSGVDTHTLSRSGHRRPVPTSLYPSVSGVTGVQRQMATSPGAEHYLTPSGLHTKAHQHYLTPTAVSLAAEQHRTPQAASLAPTEHYLTPSSRYTSAPTPTPMRSPTRTSDDQQQFWFRSDQQPVAPAQYSFAQAPPFSQPAGHFPYL